MEPSPTGEGSHRRIPVAVLVLGVLAALGLALAEPPRRTTRQDVYRIAPGTADRVAAGLSIEDVLPRRLETSVGAALTVVNEDRVSHVFGPFILSPGQSWSQRYGLSGDYAVACSLYPEADLVIAVDEAPGTPGGAARAARLAAIAWALCGCLLVGAIGLELARGLPATAGDGPAGGRGPAGGPDWAVTWSWSLAAGLVAVVALEVVALSRLAPVRAVLASRALPPWMVAGLAALGGAFLAGWAASQPRWRMAGLAAASAFVIAAIAAALVPPAGVQALGWALAAAGVGLLAASVVAARMTAAPQPSAEGEAGGLSAEDAPAVAGRLAVAGFALVVAGLDWPAPAPAWLAARGAVAVALAALLVAVAHRPPRPASVALVRWLDAFGAVLAVGGAALLFGALLWHIELGVGG
jgi:hypothetical protein